MNIIAEWILLLSRLPLQHEEDAAAKGTLPKVCGDTCSTGGQAFTRNATDTFILKNLTDVGRLKQLEISHDDTGIGAGEPDLGNGI